ncbi:MAG: flagellar biosynthesis protein FlhF [Treponema sp.]|jgi:flagellar biosynthesis protein FlhF|nr:flagellar biosynthesis protein FlhF [Treponema sp.]
MECFVEQGVSYNDCMSRIYAKYGERIVPVSQRAVRTGGFLGLFAREAVEVTFYIPPINSRSFASQGGRASGGNAPLDFEKEKEKVIAAAGKDPTQQTILKELRDLKEEISSANTAARREEHANLVKIEEMLARNDFSPAYIQGILDRARRELTLETLDNFDELQDKALEWIGESILIHEEDQFQRRPRILVLVGPTGVGKTTTIAKLAAIFGLANSGKPLKSVRLITIDAFRIGAKAQIEAYGNIMGFPVAYVDNYRDLKKEIALSSEADLILVDTIGKSPRDSGKLGEMKELLDACGTRAEVHLAVSATTKSSDLREILMQFEPFDYQSVVLTKLDETIRVGNVISALSEKGKKISYITDGQKVPNDIQQASVVRFLVNLEDFRVDREKIEKRFPVDTLRQIQWS